MERRNLSANVFHVCQNSERKVFVRADSGFFNGEILEVLEENFRSYLIKVKMKNLNKLLMQQKWQKVRGQKGFESTELNYKCQGWKRERRFVAIRQIIDSIPEKTLFPVPSSRILLLRH